MPSEMSSIYEPGFVPRPTPPMDPALKARFQTWHDSRDQRESYPLPG